MKKLIAAFAYLSNKVKSDPGFSCVNKETGTETILDLEGYIECGTKCTCSVFEIICLVKDEETIKKIEQGEKLMNNGFTMALRSVNFM